MDVISTTGNTLLIDTPDFGNYLGERLTFFSNSRWNQLDVAIVFLSVLGIVLEELKSDLMPINPTIMRVMRVLRIARGSNTYNTYTFSPHYARVNRVRVTTNTASEYKYLVFSHA